MSNVRTHIGPYPPSKPKGGGSGDHRTYIWSRCWDCGWLAEHLEETQSMAHTIAVAEHRCPQVVQLDLFEVPA